jgi:hypothetical protein
VFTLEYLVDIEVKIVLEEEKLNLEKEVIIID